MQVRSVLTRTRGFLRTACSPTLQLSQGCSCGSALCDVGCDVGRNGRLAAFLSGAMASVEAACTDLAYRDRMVDIARRRLPGRVGVSVDGFAGRFLLP